VELVWQLNTRTDCARVCLQCFYTRSLYLGVSLQNAFLVTLYVFLSSRSDVGILLLVNCFGPVERAPTTHRIGAFVGHISTENVKLAASSGCRKPVA
jgi:hypothetical protein